MSESVGLTHSRRLRRTSASSLGTVPVRRRNVQFLSRKIKNACSNFLPACANWVNRREQHRYDSEVNLPLRVCCAAARSRQRERRGESEGASWSRALTAPIGSRGGTFFRRGFSARIPSGWKQARRDIQEKARLVRSTPRWLPYGT